MTVVVTDKPRKLTAAGLQDVNTPGHKLDAAEDSAGLATPEEPPQQLVSSRPVVISLGADASVVTVDELVQQAERGRKQGQSSLTVTVSHPGHVLYPLDASSSEELQVLAAFVPADADL